MAFGKFKFQSINTGPIKGMNTTNVRSTLNHIGSAVFQTRTVKYKANSVVTANAANRIVKISLISMV